ncbi:DUF373 family protein [Natronobacterium gregoryi]|uniref:DUF373 domain-containing protein n=2 Tax=Natronobacterium gregoryi TaxID=44930 RepID=L0ADH4_NATGS|nr:DUF373 family protein [Natronobacterium gregoryi]AFZ71906.1 putative membrane protein [Natronobacterium gregoryi SP2]ELY62473.1 hypothetical protein C490_17963 [Natronobacterium gregoryi SP2]PLK20690.1 DUF373 domain-containing protein [Natronobacterium gregoryi SP2]SFJ14286.1 putative membrane protein [Natronobacterium gregoryi]
MTTLVVRLDRTDDVGRKTGLRTPIVGWEAVRALVTDIGLADPEDSGVNSLLETLRVAQDLRDENEETIVAVVSGDRESMVSADRAVARQLDELIDEHEPDSAVVVIDSAEDERLVPIVESRVQVDSVDRVVVRQARDIESTYYLLKQFLADEELRQTILVPVGITLLVFPVLAMQFGTAEGAAAITTVIGLFLLYKGLNVDEIMTGVAHQAREALYSGQVSVVTYVVAAGLTLVGLFAGALGVSSLDDPQGVFVPTMQFVFDSIPWLAMAGITASVGRILDEIIGEAPVRRSYLNLPFLLLAVALVLRGFAAYFLEQQGVIGSLAVPGSEFVPPVIEGVAFSPVQRLIIFVSTAIAVSLVGARIAVAFSGRDELSLSDDTDSSPQRSESGLTDGGPDPSIDGRSAPDREADSRADAERKTESGRDRDDSSDE